MAYLGAKVDRVAFAFLTFSVISGFAINPVI
jgi:hypothetical protein